jgi:hypothetical protein
MRQRVCWDTREPNVSTGTFIRPAIAAQGGPKHAAPMTFSCIASLCRDTGRTVVRSPRLTHCIARTASSPSGSWRGVDAPATLKTRAPVTTLVD